MDSNDPSPADPTCDPATIHDPQSFADALNAARERAGLTVRDLAKKSGVRHSTLGGYLSGRHLPRITQLDNLRAVLGACGITDEATVAQWCEALHRIRRVPGPRPADAPVPYRGLASFEPDDAEWFFGRETLTATTVATALAAENGVTAVVGPSGSGKSSLLRAGVVPALWREWPDGAVWLLTPGRAPVRELASRAATALDGDPTALADALLADPRRCVEHAQAVAADRHLTIIVDQCEELFTECDDDRQRTAFLEALFAAAGRATVFLGLRADFYHRALKEPLLVPALTHSQVPVGPMTEEELREAITGPARKAQLEVEPALVEILLRDLAAGGSVHAGGTAYDVGVLPLLSHALLATWQGSSRGRMTVAAYRAVGGVQGAVAHTADAVLESIDDVERAWARRVMTRLVRIGDDGTSTRRRARIDELQELANPVDSGDDLTVLDQVLDRLVAQRLITLDTDGVTIAHETLVAAWPRLQEWVDAERHHLRMRQQILEDARRWDEDRRDPAFLYRGSRLSTAREWADRGGHRELDAAGRAFLYAGVRRSRRRVRLLYQTIAALTVLLLLAVGGGAYAVQQRGEALRQRAAATEQRYTALSQMLAVRADQLQETDPALAAQLALAAYELTPTVEARSSLLSAASQPEVTRTLAADGVLHTVAIHPDRRLLATTATDGSAQLSDITDRHDPRPYPNLPVRADAHALVFDPDGDTLAVGGAGGTVHVVDIADPKAPATGDALATGTTDLVGGVAFGPDGDVLAAGTAAGTVHLWDLSTSGTPTPVAGTPLTVPDRVAAVAIDPTGRHLAVGGHDDAVHLWRLSGSGRPERRGPSFSAPDLAVYSLAFSPDGTTLAAGSGDKNTYLWDLHSLDREADAQAPSDILTGPNSWVNAVAFSPDGDRVAAGSSDGEAWLWDRHTGEPATTLPHPGPVTGVSFDAEDPRSLYTSGADGAVRRWTTPGPVLAGATDTVHGLAPHPEDPTVATASGDGEVRLWDIADPQRPALLADPLTSPDEADFLVGTITLTPDGDTLLASGREGTTWWWDVSDPTAPTLAEPPLPGPDIFPERLTYSPDGALLAAGVADGTIHLWDSSTPTAPEPLSVIDEPDGNVYSVAVHPERALLAAGGLDSVSWLWDISDPGRPRLLGEVSQHPNSVYSVAFNPDGDTLAVGSADETVQLWDITEPSTPTRRTTLTEADGYVLWIDYSPDGRYLAAASTDRTVRIWDLEANGGAQPYATLTGHAETVQHLTYLPEGDLLLSGSQDTTARLWHTRPESAAAHICATAGDQVTPEEWRQHVPGVGYEPPC